MEKDIVNVELEQLEDKNARLPNGEYMDLYSLKEEVLLYATSIEGDDYVVGPLFYVPGDAILNSLNIRYLRDTIGFASEDKMANSPSSDVFRFNSMIRIREYRVDSRVFFYDSRNKSKPLCVDVGVSNFKTNYTHRLPIGNDVNKLQGTEDYYSKETQKEKTSKSQDLSVDEILKNIVLDVTEYEALKIEAFYFCEPGKRLRIEKSYRTDMSKLWTFYAQLLSKGFTPMKIRAEAFLGPKSKIVIPSLLQARQIPSMIGSLPDKVENSIDNGEKLDAIMQVCATSVLGQKACVSGIFYEKLFKRDVKSISNYFSPTSFDQSDNEKYYPRIDIASHLKTPYITNWFFFEDFIPQLGRGSIAYNWNYNRYLDINTVIYWILFKLSKPEKGSSGKRQPWLIPSQLYDPQNHLQQIDHRFSEDEIDSFQRIIAYDYMNEIRIIFNISGDGIVFISTELISDNNRANERRTQIQKFLEQIITRTENKFKLTRAYNGIGIEQSKEVQLITLNPSNQTVNKIPTNWRILLVISSFLRYLIKRQEFDFIAFEA